MKTACVYHAIDLDGWMSAAIVKHWFITNTASNLLDVNLDNPNTIEFIGYNYGQPLPGLADYDQVILVDISFPKEIMLELNVRLGENLIWIYHHQRTVNEVNAYLIEYGKPMEGLVTEDGELKAACELAWEYFFPEEKMPEIVRLLGRYDCFGHMGTPEEKTIVEFQYGARECIFDYQTAYAYLVDEGTEFKNPEVNTLNIILEKGKSIYCYLCTEAKQTYQNGFDIMLYWVEDKGTTVPRQCSGKFKCVNKDRFNAINFGINYHVDGYDGQATFQRTKDGKWTFSFYSQTVDCSVIAKQFGGGGHKGAAGCVVDDETMLKIINS